MPEMNKPTRAQISRRLQKRKWEWNLRRLFSRYATVLTRQGTFKLDLRDKSISWKLFVQRQYELAWVNKVISFLSETGRYQPSQKGTVLDIGANNGVISIGLLHRNEFFRAIAIEPEPHNFELLKSNVVLNQLEDRMICLAFAASDKSGQLEFEVSKRYFGVHRIKRDENVQATGPKLESEKRELVHIPAEKTDRLLQDLPGEFVQNIRLIWIDIQGYEGFAFRGAEELLNKDIPVVTELWPYGIVSGGMKTEEYCSIARRHWKNYWVLDDEKLVPYPVSDLPDFIETLSRTGNYTNLILTK